MSQAGIVNISDAGGGGIQTINGDVGSITGSTVTIYAHQSALNCGSSVEFVNSGTISTLNVTDANDNIIIGLDAGNLTITGTTNLGLGFDNFAALTSGNFNTAIGNESLAQLTTGSSNTAVGIEALTALITGSSNTAVGQNAGRNYGSSESSNICIGNGGTPAESNVIRIGTQGNVSQQQNKCFIAGITGVTVANPALVYLNTSTGQLGTANGLVESYVTTAINYLVLVTNVIIGVTNTSSPRTITMPNSGMTTGQIWTIKDESGGAQANNITISGNGANIDGAANYVMNNNYESVDIYFNGTNFFII